jgi:hypothetical protein
LRDTTEGLFVARMERSEIRDRPSRIPLHAGYKSLPDQVQGHAFFGEML